MASYGRSYGVYRRQLARGLAGPPRVHHTGDCPGCGQTDYLYRDAAKPEQAPLCVECIRAREKERAS